MNNCTFRGYLGKDPQIGSYGDGKKRASFSLAVQRYNSKDETDWIPCTVFGKRAEVVEKYCKSGSHVLVTGAMQSSTYQDKDGNNRSSLGLVVNNLELLPKSQGQGQAQPQAQQQPQAAVQPQQGGNDGNTFMEIPEGADDSGLPFNF